MDSLWVQSDWYWERALFVIDAFPLCQLHNGPQPQCSHLENGQE